MDRIMDKTTPHPLFKLATELGPLIVFFVANAKFNLFVATGAFMVDQMFNLTPQGWRILTLRWALWFLAMAVLNEIIWRTQSTDFWVAFKAFGMVPLTMLFAVTQMPLVKRYHLEPASLEASEADAGDVSKG